MRRRRGREDEEKEKRMEEVVMKDAEEAEKEDDKKGNGKSSLCVPNEGKGLDLEKYSWTQTLQEVPANIPVLKGTKGRFVVCDIKKNHLKVGLKGQPPVIEFDEGQKAMGLPTSATEMRREEIPKQLMAEHPELDFSKTKIS